MIHLSDAMQKMVTAFKKNKIIKKDKENINRIAMIMAELRVDVQLRDQIIQDMKRRHINILKQSI